MRAELETIPVTVFDIDAGNATRIRARPDNLAIRLGLELEIAARVIGMMVRVEYVCEPPALLGKGRTDRARRRRIDRRREIVLHIVNEVTVVIAQARKHLNLYRLHGSDLDVLVEGLPPIAVVARAVGVLGE
jgi:hypothetical protein